MLTCYYANMPGCVLVMLGHEQYMLRLSRRVIQCVCFLDASESLGWMGHLTLIVLTKKVQKEMAKSSSSIFDFVCVAPVRYLRVVCFGDVLLCR